VRHNLLSASSYTLISRTHGYNPAQCPLHKDQADRNSSYSIIVENSAEVPINRYRRLRSQSKCACMSLLQCWAVTYQLLAPCSLLCRTTADYSDLIN